MQGELPLQACRCQARGFQVIVSLHLAQVGGLQEGGGGLGVVLTDVLREAGDVVLLPLLQPVAVDGGADGRSHDVAHGDHKEELGSEVAHG